MTRPVKSKKMSILSQRKALIRRKSVQRSGSSSIITTFFDDDGKRKSEVIISIKNLNGWMRGEYEEEAMKHAGKSLIHQK